MHFKEIEGKSVQTTCVKPRNSNLMGGKALQLWSLSKSNLDFYSGVLSTVIPTPTLLHVIFHWWM